MNIANFNIDEHYVSADRINAGSFTRLKDFEECPLRAWLKYSAKVPEPAPPVGKETPLDRGTRVHKDAELYVKGQKPITTELTAFEQELYGLHQVFLETPENISLEEMWCFDEDLKPVAWNDWDNTWLRVKQDAVVRNPHASTLVCIDFKTGKKKGNEIKHNDQLRLAAVAAYHKYGNDYQQYTLENWYTDQDDLVSIDMTAEDIAGLTEGYVKRLLALTTAVQFEPRPNTNVCRFCPYKTGKINKDQVGSGHCSLNPC
jgi:RecB family exonuclease